MLARDDAGIGVDIGELRYGPIAPIDDRDQLVAGQGGPAA